MAAELARDPAVVNGKVGAGQTVDPGFRDRPPAGVDAGPGARASDGPIQGIGGG
jgi:hypothetical protein